MTSSKQKTNSDWSIIFQPFAGKTHQEKINTEFDSDVQKNTNVYCLCKSGWCRVVN